MCHGVLFGTGGAWRGVVGEVRTFISEGARLLANLLDLAKLDEVDAAIAKFTELERLCLEQDRTLEVQKIPARVLPSLVPRPVRSSHRSPVRNRL